MSDPMVEPVAGLFVDLKGVYSKTPGVHVWDTRVGNHKDQWRHGTMSHIIHRSERKTIYDRYQAGESQASIALGYGVDSSTIGFNIRRYCEETGAVRKDPSGRKIPLEDLPSVFEAYSGGTTLREIAQVYEASQTVVLKSLQAWHMGTYRVPLPRRTQRLSRRIQIDEAEVVRRLYLGESERSIAGATGCSTGPIKRVKALSFGCET